MLLQSVAWVGMIADFSQKNSLQTAVTMTFDGNHPCPLCLAVKPGDNSEKQSDKPDLLKGKDLGCFALNEIFHDLPPSPKGSKLNPTPHLKIRRQCATAARYSIILETGMERDVDGVVLGSTRLPGSQRLHR